MRIAIAGLQHETNTFAGGVTGRDAFAAPGGWPPLRRGAEMFDLAETSVPMAGALSELDAGGATFEPLLWGMALPSGPVDHGVFATLRDEILDRLAGAGPVDGVLIELHGAMVTTQEPDAEGALLEALRGVVGPDVPVVATLDLHANLTARMVEAADVLEVYRTYPHVDMADTGRRAGRRMIALASGAPCPAKSFRAVPYLLPLIAQATGSPPVARLYSQARADEASEDAAITLATGFPYADIAGAGPALAVYAATQARADALADRHLALWEAAEQDLTAPVHSPQEAVALALAMPAGPGPVVLADVQDNPGGGGTQDTTGLLRALVDGGAQGAVMVHLCDAEAARAAQAAGVGATLDRAIGAAGSPDHGAPVPGPWTVRRLGTGRFVGEGPMYRGNQIDLGPVALLDQAGVGCIVAGSRMQASEPALLRHLGVDPADVALLALKSSVHFRGAYQDMARAILHVAAPGGVPMDLTTLPYRHATRRVAGTRVPNSPVPTGDLT